MRILSEDQVRDKARENMMIHKDGKTNLELADTMSADAAHWMHDLYFALANLIILFFPFVMFCEYYSAFAQGKS